jgi:hypothetical protein
MFSSPGVVNPTDSPPIPGTPHSGARSLPRTPASGVSRTPGSAARSGPGGRRCQSVQPSPNRSDLGRGSSQVRAAVGSQGEEAGSGNHANTQIWGTDIHVSETQAAVKRFFLEFTPEGRDEPLYEQLLHQAYANSQYWINLDCGHLRSFDSSLYQKLIRFPTEAITILDVVLTELYTEMFQNRSDFQEVSIVSRPFNLEDSVVMRNLNPSDVDKLVSIKGMVIRRYVYAVHNRPRLREIALFSGSKIARHRASASARDACLWCAGRALFGGIFVSDVLHVRAAAKSHAARGLHDVNVCARAILLNQLVHCARHPARIFRVHDMPSAGGS